MTSNDYITTTGEVAIVERPRCRSCLHPAHLGLCLRRSGGTAYACLCSSQEEPPSGSHELARMLRTAAGGQAE